MICSWSWAESWPQAQVLGEKSWLYQKESSCPPCHSVPGPHMAPQGQDLGVEPATK